MAKISFKNLNTYGEKLKQFEDKFETDDLIEKAVYKGANIVANRIRANLKKLPTDDFRRLSAGGLFVGLSESQKKDLQDGFGLTKIRKDRNGFIHTKAGFDGYGSFPTKSYPRGVPNQLLARATESGSSVRMKTPFVRTAVRATRKEATEAMDRSIDDNLKDIF